VCRGAPFCHLLPLPQRTRHQRTPSRWGVYRGETQLRIRNVRAGRAHMSLKKPLSSFPPPNARRRGRISAGLCATAPLDLAPNRSTPTSSQGTRGSLAGRDGRWAGEGAAHLHRGTVGRVFVAIRTRGHDARVCETPRALLSLGERCDATVLSNEGAAFTRAGAAAGWAREQPPPLCSLPIHAQGRGRARWYIQRW